MLMQPAPAAISSIMTTSALSLHRTTSRNSCVPSVQATVSGFRLVDRDNVFRVCDQPHPLLVKEIVDHCSKARMESAYLGMKVCVTPGPGTTHLCVEKLNGPSTDSKLKQPTPRQCSPTLWRYTGTALIVVLRQ